MTVTDKTLISMSSSASQAAQKRSRGQRFRAATMSGLSLIGFDKRDWARIELYAACDRFVAEHIDLEAHDVLAISSAQHISSIGFKKFKAVEYPAFDICRDVLDASFDLIIADQVFEHVRYPYRAGRNVHSMLKLGGYFLIAVPFLLRIHPAPLDCTRWSEEGLRYFLEECGFDDRAITTGSWGNRQYVMEHLLMREWWPRRGFFGSLRNDPLFPVTTWAFARRTA